MGEKLIRVKETWAREGRALTGGLADRAQRLPPGQHLVTGLPVLDLGAQPNLTPAQWELTAAGAVEAPLKWSWRDLMNQPQVETTVDIHCVTTWSSYDNVFTGVSFRHFLEIVRPRETAKFVMARGFDGYSTNIPLADLQEGDAMLCHSWNGERLTREHGGPVRLLAANLYFWKSAKWLRHLTFMEQDQPGFWEARGYHLRGDPWMEERYGR